MEKLEEYIKGFNQGFLIANYTHLKSKNFEKLDQSMNFNHGFVSGMVEFENLKFKNRNQQLEEIRDLKKNKSKNLERGK